MRNRVAAPKSPAKSCTVEIGWSWDNYETYQECGKFASVRAAKRDLWSAIYDHVSHLSPCCYHIRLRMADGSVKPLTDWLQCTAEEMVKNDKHHNSIGARMRRGETVVC